ncbi:hypothetical protein San01_23010 [Streptomyces angustmyceticus]|uniref:Uncharacterized protein n=1 Tax=Streptomyces angustmyceticus TaxID=285578 RepID=A0A5J4LB21_9ACTN|nr:hypothetical protein San01_23010 [Streptomyces angustmyceticus]
MGSRQVHDARDVVAVADREQGIAIGDVRLLDRHPRSGEYGGEFTGAALDHHAVFAQVEERSYGMGSDEAETSGDEDHDVSFR